MMLYTFKEKGRFIAITCKNHVVKSTEKIAKRIINLLLHKLLVCLKPKLAKVYFYNCILKVKN